MPYYDRIARRWHRVTGHRGGALKEQVLNDRILARIGAIQERSVLEIGAGNGYFAPLMLRRFSGQDAARLVITDASQVLLDLARREFPIARAEYQLLDARASFPFTAHSFDLILATMVFNEIATPGLRRALAECRRILGPHGRLIATVTHPKFVASLRRRGLLLEGSHGLLTMPGAAELRLPVVPRSHAEYDNLFAAAGFAVEAEEIYPTAAVLNAKPGLRRAKGVPVALLFDCVRNAVGREEFIAGIG